MRIINVRDGQEMQVGDYFKEPPIANKPTRLLAIEEGFWSAVGIFDQDGELLRVPLQVRYTHPQFFLQKVGFIPS